MLWRLCGLLPGIQEKVILVISDKLRICSKIGMGLGSDALEYSFLSKVGGNPLWFSKPI